MLGATWSSKSYAILDQDFRLLGIQFLRSIFLGAPGPTLARSDDSWSFFYNFDQFFYTEEGDNTQGIGLFGRFGMADDRTNPIEAFYSIGIGGKGIIPSRDQDTFGVGFFLLKLSDKIPNTGLNLLDDHGTGMEMF